MGQKQQGVAHAATVAMEEQFITPARDGTKAKRIAMADKVKRRDLHAVPNRVISEADFPVISPRGVRRRSPRIAVVEGVPPVASPGLLVKKKRKRRPKKVPVEELEPYEREHIQTLASLKKLAEHDQDVNQFKSTYRLQRTRMQSSIQSSPETHEFSFIDGCKCLNLLRQDSLQAKRQAMDPPPVTPHWQEPISTPISTPTPRGQDIDEAQSDLIAMTNIQLQAMNALRLSGLL